MWMTSDDIVSHVWLLAWQRRKRSSFTSWKINVSRFNASRRCRLISQCFHIAYACRTISCIRVFARDNWPAGFGPAGLALVPVVQHDLPNIVFQKDCYRFRYVCAEFASCFVVSQQVSDQQAKRKHQPWCNICVHAHSNCVWLVMAKTYARCSC